MGYWLPVFGVIRMSRKMGYFVAYHSVFVRVGCRMGYFVAHLFSHRVSNGRPSSDCAPTWGQDNSTELVGEYLDNDVLRSAVDEMEHGLIDADLGGHVVRKRVAIGAHLIGVQGRP